MTSSNTTIILFILVSVFTRDIHNLDLTDLQTLVVACPERDRCKGYMNNLTFLDRSCECDFACNTYKDCCIDALRWPQMKNSLAHHMACMPYGEQSFQGVYVIVNCSSNWKGFPEVRQRCEGPQKFSDLLAAAPVTSVEQGVTYRNLFCAECNYAKLPTLELFQIRIACNGLTDDQILGDLKYNENVATWGVHRLNSFGNATDFIGCEVIFDVPEHLTNSVRFCRSSVISSCPPEWSRQQVRKNCEDYMAVVHSNGKVYRNVYCAICNNIKTDQVSCGNPPLRRKTELTGIIYLVLNKDGGGDNFKIIRPECPTAHIYDPSFRMCRQLGCALHNYVMQNGNCIRR